MAGFRTPSDFSEFLAPEHRMTTKIKTAASIKTPSPLESSTLDRRQFLKTGLLGGVLLSTAHLSACSSQALKSPLNQNPQSPYVFLTRDDAVMLSAMLPAMIAGNWPETDNQQRQAEARTLTRIDQFLSRMGAFNQHEIRKLFDLLQLRPARGLTTGIWRDWQNTDAEQVDAFLQRWKHSSINLFNSGYNALSDILCFAWYTDPLNTQAFGYSGPPDYLLESLPQFQIKHATSHYPAGSAS
jgi:hypothetical protein